MRCLTRSRNDHDGGAKAWLLLAVVVVTLALAGCSGGDGDAPTTTTKPDTGPLALLTSEGSDDSGFSGTLRITEDCTFIRDRAGNDWALAWPADRTRWDDGQIRFEQQDGGVVVLADGDAVDFGGGADALAESGRSNREWLDLDAWVVAPDASCVREQRFGVGEATLTR